MAILRHGLLFVFAQMKVPLWVKHTLIAALIILPELLLAWQAETRIRPMALVISGCIFAFLPAALFVATNRFAFSWAMWLVIMVLLCVIHAAKFHFLQSPLFLTDFFPATMQTMLGVLPGLSLFVKLLTLVTLLAILLSTIFLFRRLWASSSKASLRMRITTVLLTGALPLTLLFSPQSAYERFLPSLGAGMSDFSRPFSLAHLGFTGSLWHDVRYLFGQNRPAGYTKEEMQRIAERYAPNSAQKNTMKPSVIVMLLESFWDPLAYPELQVSPDPIPFFRSLQKKYPHGNVRVPMYGGGTALAEFEILTALDAREIRGYPYVNLRQKIPSLASVFAARGHRTTFLHGYTYWFYARDRAVPLMGFENFVYDTHIRATFPGIKIDDDRYITDEFFMKMLLRETKQRPFFIFASTYGTHGPFANEGGREPYHINPVVSAKARDALQANFMLLREADRQIEQLLHGLQNQPGETIVFMFGDHVPSETYIHLDLRTYDAQKPFMLPYLLVNPKRPEGKTQQRDLHTTQVGDLVLRASGIAATAQFRSAAARDSMMQSSERALIVYDLMFGKQFLQNAGAGIE